MKSLSGRVIQGGIVYGEGLYNVVDTSATVGQQSCWET